MNNKIRRGTIGVAMFGMVVVLSACGGGSGGGGGCPTTEPESCITGLSGDWNITDDVSTSAQYCASSDGQRNIYTVTVTQTGCSLTVTSGGQTLNGFIDGNSLCWTGSYEENGGTTTIVDMDLTVNDAGTEFSGSSSWTWTDNIGECNGQTSTQGEKS